MDKPYPENLMAVPACRECNNGLSLDEEYLACFLECVIAGDTAPEKLHRAKIGRILRANCSLLARLQVARMDGVEGTIWVAENDRVSRVILKLARCHAAFGPAGKIRVKTGHFINFYSGRAVQVGIASGFKLVG